MKYWAPIYLQSGKGSKNISLSLVVHALMLWCVAWRITF